MYSQHYVFTGNVTFQLPVYQVLRKYIISSIIRSVRDLVNNIYLFQPVRITITQLSIRRPGNDIQPSHAPGIIGAPDHQSHSAKKDFCRVERACANPTSQVQGSQISSYFILRWVQLSKYQLVNVMPSLSFILNPFSPYGSMDGGRIALFTIE